MTILLTKIVAVAKKADRTACDVRDVRYSCSIESPEMPLLE